MNKITLQDCLKAVIDNRGVTPHKRGTEWQDSGIPVLSANNVKTSGLQKLSEIRYIPEEVYSSWMKIPLEKGDIILTSEAPAGEVLYWDSDDKVALGQRLYGLKIRDGINSKYLKYYLQSAVGQKAIQGQNSGSTVFGIAAATFPFIELYLPEITEQNTVAELLYSIDLCIANNTSICSVLEAMAKDLYDYWFVQFDFPDENGRPYKSSGGKMVWNEELKREVPEGWEVGCFKDVLEIGNGKDHKALAEGDIPVYGSGGFMRTVNSSLYEGESVLIPRKGTLNNIMYVNEAFWTVDTMFYTKMKRAHSAKYMYYSAKIYDLERLNTGTGVPSMTADIVYKLKVVIPSEGLLKRFDQAITPWYQMISERKKENQHLAELRDFLLPMLMNGQVKVGKESA